MHQKSQQHYFWIHASLMFIGINGIWKIQVFVYFRRMGVFLMAYFALIPYLYILEKVGPLVSASMSNWKVWSENRDGIVCEEQYLIIYKSRKSSHPFFPWLVGSHAECKLLEVKILISPVHSVLTKSLTHRETLNIFWMMIKSIDK